MERGAILIKVCLNGARMPDQHPAVPVTPDQLAAEARAAVQEGAGAVHIHPRSPEGRQTLDPAAIAAAVAAVRAAVPGVPVGVTTGAWIEPHPGRLDTVRRWQVLPDFASVNFVEEGAAELATLLLDMGVDVETGLFSVDDARRLVESGLAGRCFRYLVEVGRDPARAVEAAAEIDAYLESAGLPAPRLHHGSGQVTWAVLAAAIDLGRDIRVGLEDTFLLPDGATATGNGDLVRAAAAMVRARGREIAKP